MTSATAKPMTVNEQRAKAVRDKEREAVMRRGANGVLAALCICPGDGALNRRELLRAEIESALSKAFQDGYDVRTLEGNDRADEISDELEAVKDSRKEVLETLGKCIPWLTAGLNDGIDDERSLETTLSFVLAEAEDLVKQIEKEKE